jgi:uncharacterized protein (TIGR01777 family)
MRVLITGASGLIGSTVAETLLARGDEVVGLSRDPASARSKSPRVTWHAWEPASEQPPAAALEGVDAVVNLIGENINQRLTEEAKRRIRDSRVRATENLVAAMLAAPRTPAVLVSQSAVGYYGDHGAASIDESTPPDRQFLSQMVVEWEQAALAAEPSGVRVTVLRTAPVLDPDGGLLKQLMLPFKLGVGGPLAGGDWYQPWIHRDDAAGMLIWALDDDTVSGAINASAPETVTNKRFSKAFGKALGRPSLVPAPKLAVRALRGGELTEHITASMRVEPRRALDLGYRFRFPEIEPALRDLVG